ncbi:hypothetical protein FQN57_007311 [Myotisia sp. PD_48]|nr:hypothetical protein FQN57_007311 [Myotisia sp. PD_48]
MAEQSQQAPNRDISCSHDTENHQSQSSGGVPTSTKQQPSQGLVSSQYQAQTQAQAQLQLQSQSHVQSSALENPQSCGPTATAPFLQDFSLVAEAAKRAQMAVMMRDLENVSFE